MQKTEFISTKEIANLLNYSTTYTRRRIITSPNFPTPYKLPTGHKRWKKSEVLYFIEKYKQTKTP